MVVKIRGGSSEASTANLLKSLGGSVGGSSGGPIAKSLKTWRKLGGAEVYRYYVSIRAVASGRGGSFDGCSS
jgi:hypothetical protein